jgi:MFS family permease
MPPQPVAKGRAYCYNPAHALELLRDPPEGLWIGIGIGHPGGREVVNALFRSARPVPAQYRSNFMHLYFDIAWFGVLSASAMSFVAVYATRQGASAFQIGLLSAGPATVNLALTLPTGRWLETQSIDTAVFWGAALHRFFYLLWVPLPLLLVPQAQVWAFIGLTLLMSIPGTALAVGFNALFADAVPPDWRGHVAGIRNALLAVIVIAVSLLCGQILSRVPFPTGYQVVFGIGALGAVMSTFHLRFVTPLPNGQVRPRVGRSLGDLAWPGTLRTVVDSLRPGVALRFLVRRRRLPLLDLGIMKGPFGRLVAVLFAFFLALHLAIPLFPLRWVNELALTDRNIGLGNAVFYVSVFVGSTQLDRLTRRLGNQRVTAIGAVLMSSYPAFMAWAQGLELFLVGSAAGGLGWSLVGGALTNYLLEKIPADHRPAYLAWYNLATNAALLLGSLVGPLVAGVVGVPAALLAFAALRFLGAWGILLWERR